MSGGTLPEEQLLDQIAGPAPVAVPEPPADSFRQSDVDLIDQAYEKR